MQAWIKVIEVRNDFLINVQQKAFSRVSKHSFIPRLICPFCDLLHRPN
jgi:hypothetical protein